MTWVEFSKLHGPIYVSLAQMHIFFSNTSPAHVNRWGRCLLLLLKVSGSNKRYRLVRNGDLKMGHTPHMAIFMGLKSLACGGFPFSCSWSPGICTCSEKPWQRLWPTIIGLVVCLWKICFLGFNFQSSGPSM